MAFEKGHKHGKGRIPGSKNVASIDLQNFMKSFLLDNKKTYEAAFLKLTPFQQVTAYKDLMRFVMPVMSSVEQTSEIERMPEDQLDLIIENLKNVKANGTAKEGVKAKEHVEQE